MLVALLVVLGLGIGTSKAFDHNRKHAVKPFDAVMVGSHKTGYIQGLSPREISEIVGMEPNKGLTADDKSHYGWDFTINGAWFSIWHYRKNPDGVLSTYGDERIFKDLFGDHYKTDIATSK